MKLAAMLLALASLGACKDDAPAPPSSDPCVEAGELYVINAREAGQRAFATIDDPNRRSDEEEKLEDELRAAKVKFPAACATVGGATVLRCLRLVRAAEKEAAERVRLENDAACKAAGDAIYQQLYGEPVP